jgi:hypothetical protein
MVVAVKQIPTTPLVRRYRDLGPMSQAQRLAQAREVLEQPELLAAEFAASVERFLAYDNVREHFYPPTRPVWQAGAIVERTNDVVLALRDRGGLDPIDAPDRVTDHDAGPGVTAVQAGDLACDYVDRELVVQRTTSPAAWDDGASNRGGGTRLDVLLADRADRTPIVGELKLPGDRDPYYALVQALTCASNLATPNQYARLRAHLRAGRFPARESPPRLDVFVLVVEEPGREGLPPKGRYANDLKLAAEALAPRLLVQPAITRYVRRIATVRLVPVDRVTAAHVRLAWEAAAP